MVGRAGSHRLLRPHRRPREFHRWPGSPANGGNARRRRRHHVVLGFPDLRRHLWEGFDWRPCHAGQFHAHRRGRQRHRGIAVQRAHFRKRWICKGRRGLHAHADGRQRLDWRDASLRRHAWHQSLQLPPRPCRQLDLRRFSESRRRLRPVGHSADLLQRQRNDLDANRERRGRASGNPSRLAHVRECRLSGIPR